MRTQITEATAEKIADQRVMRALDRDPRYRNAENADEQKAAEEAIEAEVWAQIERDYAIFDHATYFRLNPPRQ